MSADLGQSESAVTTEIQNRPLGVETGQYRGSYCAIGAVKSIVPMMTGTAIAMIAISIIAAPCG
jgi:hypothetical protein